MPPVIGVDFGTTNSVVAILQPDGSSRTIRFPAGDGTLDVFRSILCFWREQFGGRDRLCHAAGPRAIEVYLDDPQDTRLIMSMKSYLAQRSFSQTQIFGRPETLESLIARFLQALLASTELSGARIVAGRPVRFAGDAADHDLAETRLRGAFRRAGLGEIELALEPEAAGYRLAASLSEPATILVGDFGGGTSDFSLLRVIPGAAQPIVPLATAGVGIAGDAFDHRIIDQVVSPHLGKGTTYRVMDKAMPIPAEYYAGLSRWHRLSLMRAPRTMRELAEIARTAAEPQQIRALIHLIDEELGYQLYQSVGAAKTALSHQAEATLHFEHGPIAIHETIARTAFEAWIAADLARMSTAVDRAMAQAGLGPAEVSRVFLTGGTAFVPAVRRLFERRFGEERVSGGGEFVSVAEGLALIGRDRLADK